MGELVGVGGDFWAAENLRAKHRLPMNYSVEDLHNDLAVFDRLRGPS